MPASFFRLTLLAGMASLAVALIAQYFFHLAPCELCQWQRVPYGAVILASLFALMIKSYRRRAFALIALSFLAGSGLGMYHAGVEKHLIQGPSACTSDGSSANQSIEELMKKIHETQAVACDQPQWEFHGITLAMLNALWSFMLFLFVIYSRKRMHAETAG